MYKLLIIVSGTENMERFYETVLLRFFELKSSKQHPLKCSKIKSKFSSFLIKLNVWKIVYTSPICNILLGL